MKQRGWEREKMRAGKTEVAIRIYIYKTTLSHILTLPIIYFIVANITNTIDLG